MALQRQLSIWGFTKYLKRSEVITILRAKAGRDAAGKESVFTLRGRPISLTQVEKHRKKFGPPYINPGHLDASQSGVANSAWQLEFEGIVCRTPPPSPHASIPVIESCRVPEKLLYDFDILLKGSFEAGRWKFVSNERIIDSSEDQVLESTAIHDFIGNLTNGTTAATARNYDLAFEYWQQACVNVDTLVKGQYHDIFPNLIQQINDLNRLGFGPVAASLREHIAESSAVHGNPDEPTSAIFAGLGKLDMALMVATEERIMSHFRAVFEQYLGRRCYNSFVVMMDGARRRLLHDKWAAFADCLPELASLDDDFGPSNCRPLDVICLRLQVMKDRNTLAEAEADARELIQRADNIQNDDWQRFYYLTQGWYFLGLAQFSIPERQYEAVSSFETALHCDDGLRRVDDFHIFVAERTAMKKCLEELQYISAPAASLVLGTE